MVELSLNDSLVCFKWLNNTIFSVDARMQLSYDQRIVATCLYARHAIRFNKVALFDVVGMRMNLKQMKTLSWKAACSWIHFCGVNRN